MSGAYLRRLPHRRPARVPCAHCGDLIALPNLHVHERSLTCARNRARRDLDARLMTAGTGTGGRHA